MSTVEAQYAWAGPFRRRLLGHGVQPCTGGVRDGGPDANSSWPSLCQTLRRRNFDI